MDKKAHAHPKKFGCGSAALGGSVANHIKKAEGEKIDGKKCVLNGLKGFAQLE